jgi:Tfp pilus assembly protein PilO
MRLKPLFFPVALLVAFVVTVGYIKPAIDQLLILWAEAATQSASLEDMQIKANNVTRLTASIDQNQSGEKSVNRYLPTTVDGEVILDTINFLANQTGVALTVGIDMQAPASDPVAASATPAANSPVAPSGTASAGTPDVSSMVITDIAPAVKLKTIPVKFSVTGGYINLKDFIYRLVYTNRYNDIKSFTIAHVEASSGTDGATPTSSDALKLIIETEFSFLSPLKDSRTASANPTKEVFLQTSVDTKAPDRISAAIAKANAGVPDISLVEGGKSNPFIR